MIARTAATASAALLLVLSLAACFGGASPSVPDTEAGDPGVESSAGLAGTSWSGSDSDGEEWTFEFEADGVAEFTYNGLANDDATAMWEVSGDTLTIRLEYPTYDSELVGGPVGGGSIDLDGTYPGGTFTLTIAET